MQFSRQGYKFSTTLLFILDKIRTKKKNAITNDTISYFRILKTRRGIRYRKINVD